MKTKYPIELTEEQRETLHQLLRAGEAPARKLTHAHILLKADEGLSDPEIASLLYIDRSTAYRTRVRFVREGFESALEHKHPIHLKPPTLDGRAEAHLIALTQSPPPEGLARWNLRLLADKLVQLEVVESVSHETVRKRLKKTKLRLT
jgi:transposase